MVKRCDIYVTVQICCRAPISYFRIAGVIPYLWRTALPSLWQFSGDEFCHWKTLSVEAAAMTGLLSLMESFRPLLLSAIYWHSHPCAFEKLRDRACKSQGWQAMVGGCIHQWCWSSPAVDVEIKNFVQRLLLSMLERTVSMNLYSAFFKPSTTLGVPVMNTSKSAFLTASCVAKS